MAGDGSMTVSEAGRLGGKRNAQNRVKVKIMEDAARRAGLFGVGQTVFPERKYTREEVLWIEQQLSVPSLKELIEAQKA